MPEALFRDTEIITLKILAELPKKVAISQTGCFYCDGGEALMADGFHLVRPKDDTTPALFKAPCTKK